MCYLYKCVDVCVWVYVCCVVLYRVRGTVVTQTISQEAFLPSLSHPYKSFSTVEFLIVETESSFAMEVRWTWLLKGIEQIPWPVSNSCQQHLLLSCPCGGWRRRNELQETICLGNHCLKWLCHHHTVIGISSLWDVSIIFFERPKVVLSLCILKSVGICHWYEFKARSVRDILRAPAALQERSLMARTLVSGLRKGPLSCPLRLLDWPPERNDPWSLATQLNLNLHQAFDISMCQSFQQLWLLRSCDSVGYLFN